MLKSIPKLVALCLLSGFIALPATAQQVGEATRISDWAYRLPAGGELQDLFYRDPVALQDVLSTTNEGQLEVTFDDGSMLRIDKGSSVAIDQFVYSGAADDALHIKMGEGALRFITGQISPDAVQIETDLGYLGVRGTDVLVVFDQRIVQVFILAGVLIYSQNPLAALINPGFIPPSGLQNDGSVIGKAGYKLVLWKEGGSIRWQLVPLSGPEFLLAFNRLLFAEYGFGGFYRTERDGPGETRSRSRRSRDH